MYFCSAICLAGRGDRATKGVIMMTRSMPMPKIVKDFRADHPFYYAIVRAGRKRTDVRVPVFAGVVASAPAPPQ